VQHGHVFAQHAEHDDEFGFYAVVVDEIFTDSCGGEDGIPRPVGPGADALVTALLEQEGGAAMSDPVTTTLRNRSAIAASDLVPSTSSALGTKSMSD
jgi:hypothetical protein